MLIILKNLSDIIYSIYNNYSDLIICLIFPILNIQFVHVTLNILNMIIIFKFHQLKFI
jgi:hypothetical protein